MLFIGGYMFDITTSIDLSKLIPLNQEGKNSTVYKYYDSQLGKDLIVKIISRETLYKQYGSDYINNLFTESRTLYSTKHPNIVEIQYASYDDENVFISMPIYKNGSLQSLINKRFLTVREILKYSIEFLSGIHYIHTFNLVHYDIKPTNILINDNNKAIITDYGLVKTVDDYGLASPDMLYTKHMIPEFLEHSQTTNKADIFQAGMTIYRLCNGNDNFYAQFNSCYPNLRNDILNGKFPDRKYYLPHIPLKLKKVINKALSTNPDNRFETILDMINKLSVIDDNLDWQYEKVATNLSMWTKINDKGTHKDCISVHKNVNDTYDISGYKINLLKNNKSENHKCKRCNLTLKDANKVVAEILKE
jgi:serine/threonine protein kinase